MCSPVIVSSYPDAAGVHCPLTSGWCICALETQFDIRSMYLNCGRSDTAAMTDRAKRRIFSPPAKMIIVTTKLAWQNAESLSSARITSISRRHSSGAGARAYKRIPQHDHTACVWSCLWPA